jgi:hypothetical protein
MKYVLSAIILKEYNSKGKKIVFERDKNKKSHIENMKIFKEFMDYGEQIKPMNLWIFQLDFQL